MASPRPHQGQCAASGDPVCVRDVCLLKIQGTRGEYLKTQIRVRADSSLNSTQLRNVFVDLYMTLFNYLQPSFSLSSGNNAYSLLHLFPVAPSGTGKSFTSHFGNEPVPNPTRKSLRVG